MYRSSFLVIGSCHWDGWEGLIDMEQKDYNPFSRKRIRYVDAEEMGIILKKIKYMCLICYGSKPPNVPFSSEIAWIEDKMVNLQVTVKLDKPCTYILRKDKSDNKQEIDPMTAYATLNRYYKVPSFRKDEYVNDFLDYDETLSKYNVTSRGLLYCNQKYDKQRTSGCYGYDLNSSYPNAMLKKMPDTSKEYRTESSVGENEIGFLIRVEDVNGETETTLEPTFNGLADFVFPLMDSPFKKFVEVWYGKKKNAKTKEEKEKAKQMMNFAIGCLQKHNPFLRATILYYANLAITEHMDEDTLLCSTDSLISKRKRDDLDIGKEIGQFKLEHEGDFYYDGMNYQWNLETPTYRGIPKSWFKKGWDMSKDELPKSGNVYRFDKKSLMIKENKR